MVYTLHRKDNGGLLRNAPTTNTKCSSWRDRPPVHPSRIAVANADFASARTVGVVWERWASVDCSVDAVGGARNVALAQIKGCYPSVRKWFVVRERHRRPDRIDFGIHANIAVAERSTRIGVGGSASGDDL